MAASSLSLGRIRNQFSYRSESEKQNVTLVGFTATEDLISSMQSVQDAQGTVVLVESEDRGARDSCSEPQQLLVMGISLKTG